MTLDQLPSATDYAMTAPTPVIIVLVSVIAIIIFVGLLFMAMHKELQPRFIVTVTLAVIASFAASAFSMQASSEGLARVRGEAVSEHLKETYGVDVSFTEDGVQPTDLDGLTVYDGSSVYRITITTDGTILLVDKGGREVPRVDQ